MARLEEDTWAVPPRLPLLDAYSGECRAGSIAIAPDGATLRSTCNIGYPSGKCACFPSDARAEAVRFHIASESNGVIRLQYIFEKGCWPVDTGEAEYSAAARAFASQPEGDILRRQMAAFVESYLRRSEA